MLSAVIKKRSGLIEPREWKTVIEAHPALQPQPGRHQYNPFTRETVWLSGEDSAEVINGDGGMRLICGQLNVANVPLSICEEVAAMLGAEVQDFGEWENK